MSKKHDLPYLAFYPGDWWKDPGVKMLNHEEKGVWFEMLLLMFDSKDRGKLLINDIPMDDEMISRALNLDNQKFKVVLKQLLNFGVASQEKETGVVFSRRMVRDEEISKIRQECGKLGGNPKLISILDNQKSNLHKKKALPKRQPNVVIDTDIEIDIDTDNGNGKNKRIGIVEETFNIFWEAYPNKADRKKCLEIWTKINFKENPFPMILEKLEALKASWGWTKDGGQFIPMSRTWLNREGWNDTIKTEPPKKESEWIC